MKKVPESKPPTVDADLFDDLEDAIAFCVARGGGVVRTSLFGTQFAKSLKLPPKVRLEPMPELEPEKGQT
jgi:hypothetical protein